MVDREELTRFLLHPESSVRESVAEYFRDSWDQGEDLLPLILDACALYGDEVNNGLITNASRFRVNRESLARVISLLKRVENKDIQIHANRILAGAPADVLKANEAEIFSCPNLPDRVAERIRRRLEFSGRSGGDLWEELRRFADELDDVEEPWSRDLTHADDLVEELATRDVPDGRTICELLQSAEVEGKWLELFLVDLAGARRLREAIPALVAKLRFDDDALLESAVEGLARIGDPEAVRLIRETFHRETWDFRLVASDLLGTLKHPESEEAILALLPGEDDETIRTNLCFSLCQLLSERGIETVKAEIASDYDRGLVCLEDVLLDVAVVLGLSLPEAETWYAQREEQKRERAERLAKIAALEDQGIDPFEEGDGDVEDEGDEDFEDESDEDLDEEFEEVLSERFNDTVPFIPDAADYGDTPFRRAGPKTGRNEPCPCGSGKKYKRCCGKRN